MTTINEYNDRNPGYYRARESVEGWPGVSNGGESPCFKGRATSFKVQKLRRKGETPRRKGEMPRHKGETPRRKGETARRKGETPRHDARGMMANAPGRTYC